MAPTAPHAASERDPAFVLERCFERAPAEALEDLEAGAHPGSW